MSDIRRCLIVCHGDGFIETFADTGIQTRIEIMPYVPTPEDEVLGEKYVNSQLSRSWRELYCPGNVRATAYLRKVLPSDIADTQYDLHMLRGMAEMQRRMATPIILQAEDGNQIEQGGTVWTQY